MKKYVGLPILYMSLAMLYIASCELIVQVVVTHVKIEHIHAIDNTV